MNEQLTKKRFVLVNVPTSENAYHSLIDFVAVFPPLGLLSIASVLEKIGIDAAIVDADAMRLNLDETVAKVVSMNPDYIGSTGMTATMDIIGNFFARIRKQLPDSVIMLGGPHISALSSEMAGASCTLI